MAWRLGLGTYRGLARGQDGAQVGQPTLTNSSSYFRVSISMTIFTFSSNHRPTSDLGYRMSWRGGWGYGPTGGLGEGRMGRKVREGAAGGISSTCLIGLCLVSVRKRTRCCWGSLWSGGCNGLFFWGNWGWNSWGCVRFDLDRGSLRDCLGRGDWGCCDFHTFSFN